MHDIRAIREDPVAFDDAMVRRNVSPMSAGIMELDLERRAAQTTLGERQARRNALSKEIGQLRRTGGETAALEVEAVALRDDMVALETTVTALGADIEARLASLPNVLDPDVPDGTDETANIVVKQVGTPPEMSAARQHFELGEALGLMDFAAASKLAGSRFTVLRGSLARLERALGQWMLDLHVTEHGYEETAVPLLVNDATAYGSNQLPKFVDDMFRTADGRWLIPTAEVPLTNMVAGDIVAETRLPWRMTALTECFRSEAGSAGRDTRGMLRQHQFRKVEMVSITRPQDSDAEHERMTRCAETVLERLHLPYRRMLLCSGDTGFGAVKTFDLEVWLPGQGMWREISSCSNTRAFQARRMNGRYRPAEGKVEFVHSLNGSGVAVGRALIAVMENYQQPDGSITVPEVLRPYMAGLDRIGG
ncbi:serine--tRNA ligase [Acidisphaera sp. L21]|uniref:serine--tRNA ligase n=1 Tax=Acidisphaera sp. L21 TaxID=1641851 RepID=UPI00131CC979|nr:serine--tRNA ligase [Acidisphaera sp. L21]